MAVQSRRRDEGGEPVDELEGRERQVRAPIGTGFGQVVDQLLTAGCFQPLQGEWRSGTVPKEPLVLNPRFCPMTGAYEPKSLNTKPAPLHNGQLAKGYATDDQYHRVRHWQAPASAGGWVRVRYSGPTRQRRPDASPVSVPVARLPLAPPCPRDTPRAAKLHTSACCGTATMASWRLSHPTHPGHRMGRAHGPPPVRVIPLVRS